MSINIGTCYHFINCIFLRRKLCSVLGDHLVKSQLLENYTWYMAYVALIAHGKKWNCLVHHTFPQLWFFLLLLLCFCSVLFRLHHFKYILCWLWQFSILFSDFHTLYVGWFHVGVMFIAMQRIICDWSSYDIYPNHDGGVCSMFTIHNHWHCVDRSLHASIH